MNKSSKAEPFEEEKFINPFESENSLNESSLLGETATSV